MASRNGSEPFCSACGSKPTLRILLQRLAVPDISGTIYLCEDCWQAAINVFQNRPELVYMGRNT